MASLFMPDRFLGRSVDSFVAGLDAVTAQYWHLHSQGHAALGSAAWQSACGQLEAMHWLGGMTAFPPAYDAIMARTRSNLMRLARYSYMVIDGEGEELDREDPAAQIADPRWGAAGTVYRWALGMSNTLSAMDMLPEDIRAARRYFAAIQSRQQHAA